MANECRKAMYRRLHHPLFHRIFRGKVLDVGAGEDSIGRYRFMFPYITYVKDWNHSDGDGTDLVGEPADFYDVVHSSHSLEHMREPIEALTRWAQVCKVGGHVVVTVPDFEMYEHNRWPSENGEHKSCYVADFALLPSQDAQTPVWDTASLVDALGATSDRVRLALIRMERLESTFDFHEDPNLDQTCFGHGAAESCIEFVWRRIA